MPEGGGIGTAISSESLPHLVAVAAAGTGGDVYLSKLSANGTSSPALLDVSAPTASVAVLPESGKLGTGFPLDVDVQSQNALESRLAVAVFEKVFY